MLKNLTHALHVLNATLPLIDKWFCQNEKPLQFYCNRHYLTHNNFIILDVELETLYTNTQ